MISMTPDWTTVASDYASVSQPMRTKETRSHPWNSGGAGAFDLVRFVQKCLECVAETPDSPALLSIDSMFDNCSTYQWYGIRLAEWRPTLMNIAKHGESPNSVRRLSRRTFASAGTL